MPMVRRVLQQPRNPPSRPRGGFRRSPAPGVVQRAGAYRISPDVAVRIRAGHPWLFRDALGGRDVGEPTGTVVELLSGNREFVGRGFVDQDHAIAIRVLARDPATDVAPGTGTIAARF